MIDSFVQLATRTDILIFFGGFVSIMTLSAMIINSLTWRKLFSLWLLTSLSTGGVIMGLDYIHEKILHQQVDDVVKVFVLLIWGSIVISYGIAKITLLLSTAPRRKLRITGALVITVIGKLLITSGGNMVTTGNNLTIMANNIRLDARPNSIKRADNLKEKLLVLGINAKSEV